MKLNDELLKEMLRRMLLIRRFEENAGILLEQGILPGSAHTSIGMEATSVGACLALNKDDYELGTHRSHGHPIAKGADIKPLMAELLGKEAGINHGRSGSMHLADFGVGSLGETSIVGSGLPVATGVGLGSKLLGQNKVCLCFFGDGASSEGTFHESLNLASIWNLPVIYFCENNGYSVTTSSKKVISVDDIAIRANGYNMPGIVVDGQNVIAVYKAVKKAVDRARKGQGPSLIEAKTYRYREHAEGGMFQAIAKNSPYRDEEEIKAWMARDPISILSAKLLEEKIMSNEEIEQMDKEVKSAVREAVAYARACPDPMIKDEKDLYVGLYTNPIN